MRHTWFVYTYELLLSIISLDIAYPRPIIINSSYLELGMEFRRMHMVRQLQMECNSTE